MWGFAGNCKVRCIIVIICGFLFIIRVRKGVYLNSAIPPGVPTHFPTKKIHIGRSVRGGKWASTRPQLKVQGGNLCLRTQGRDLVLSRCRGGAGVPGEGGAGAVARAAGPAPDSL